MDTKWSFAFLLSLFSTKEICFLFFPNTFGNKLGLWARRNMMLCVGSNAFLAHSAVPLAWLSPHSHLSMCAFASFSLRMLFQVFSGLTHLSSLHSAIASSVTAQSTVAPQCPHTSVPSHHLITAPHFPSTYHSLKSFFFLIYYLCLP